VTGWSVSGGRVTADQSQRREGVASLGLAQSHRLYAVGWDIGEHTSTHADLATLDLAAAERDLGGYTRFLALHDMPGGARDVAFFLHALAPKADGDRQSIANFAAICDYIGKLHLTALAISQFCALSTT